MAIALSRESSWALPLSRGAYTMMRLRLARLCIVLRARKMLGQLRVGAASLLCPLSAMVGARAAKGGRRRAQKGAGDWRWLRRYLRPIAMVCARGVSDEALPHAGTSDAFDFSDDVPKHPYSSDQRWDQGAEDGMGFVHAEWLDEVLAPTCLHEGALRVCQYHCCDCAPS